MNDSELKALRKSILRSSERVNITGVFFWCLLSQLAWCVTLGLWRGVACFVAMILLLFVLDVASP